jgi:hypothetical protein
VVKTGRPAAKGVIRRATPKANIAGRQGRKRGAAIGVGQLVRLAVGQNGISIGVVLR